MVVALCAFLVLGGVLYAVGTLAATAIGDDEVVSTSDLDDFATPAGFLLGNLLLGAGMAVAVVAVAVVHRARPEGLLSVLGTFRWRLFGSGLWVAAAVSGTAIGLMWFLPVTEVPSGESQAEWVGAERFLVLAALILATTPLQSAGEEFFFRGYLGQALGVWTSRHWVAGIATSLLFALAHGTQGPWLFADRFAFGLVAWWLTVRTGGLESAVALHAANNVLALLIGAATGRFEETLTPEDIELPTACLDIAALTLTAVILVRLAERRGAAVVTSGRAAGG